MSTKNPTRDFTLQEILTISEKVDFILNNYELKFSEHFSINQWGKPFTSLAKDILKSRADVLKKHAKAGEKKTALTPELTKDLVDLLQGTKKVEYTLFDEKIAKLLDDLKVKGMQVLFQFYPIK